MNGRLDGRRALDAARASAYATAVPSLALSPHGHLHLAPSGEAADEPVFAEAAAPLARDDEASSLLALALFSGELAPSWDFGRAIGRLAVDAGRANPRAFDAGDELALDREQLVALVARVPPMPGAEYVTEELVEALARRTELALRSAADGALEAFLARAAPHLSVVGRVCFHLAENKSDPEHPFAFLATYAAGLVSSQESGSARVRHRLLGEALREYASARDRPLLEALLRPVARAAETSGLQSGRTTIGTSVGSAARFSRRQPTMSGRYTSSAASWTSTSLANHQPPGRRPPGLRS